MLRKLILLVAATGALYGCGSPGAPLPPSLLLPRPVEDLAATRKGNRVTLTWTPPRLTTDGETLQLRRLGPTRICRGNAFPLTGCAEPAPGTSFTMAGTVVGQLSPEQTPIPQQEQGAPKLSFSDAITPVEDGNDPEFATYALEILNARGKSAGLSNQVRVPLAPVCPAPAKLESAVEMDRIAIWWLKPSCEANDDYRLTRRDAGDPHSSFAAVECVRPPTPIARNTVACLDKNFEWEKTYIYKVTPIARVKQSGKVVAEVEGEDSPEIKVIAKDVFPPAPPSGVQAVFSGVGQQPFIDVTWAPNTEEDLAGYNVYRHEEGTPAQRINSSLLKSPSFRDSNVKPGHTYVYAVSAIDLRNNESPHSEETSETAPRQ